MRDLHKAGDGLWMQRYPTPDQRIALGEIGVNGKGPLALVSFGNGHLLSRKAQAMLAVEGIETRVVDLRWLAPLPTGALLSELRDATHALIVDETRSTGGLSESLMAQLAESSDLRLARLAAEDSFIATGHAYAATMPSADGIAAAARTLVEIGE